jgi:hypothetical protein
MNVLDKFSSGIVANITKKGHELKKLGLVDLMLM